MMHNHTAVDLRGEGRAEETKRAHTYSHNNDTYTICCWSYHNKDATVLGGSCGDACSGGARGEKEGRRVIDTKHKGTRRQEGEMAWNDGKYMT